jgi:hypothetical protein
MSQTKLPLGRNNSVMTSLFPPRESLVVTSRLGTGNSPTFFYGVNALSAGANTTTLYVMVDKVKGVGRASPTLTSDNLSPVSLTTLRMKLLKQLADTRSEH